MDMVVPLQHRQHGTLRGMGGPLADALGARGGGATGFHAELEFSGMQRTHAWFQGFVTASPHVHRAKKWGPRVALFPASPREASLKSHARRRVCGVLGLQMIQEPGQNASTHLTEERAAFPRQFRPLLGRRLVVEELIP
jgi:hypothetical protein